MPIFDTHAHYFKSDFGGELDGLLSSMPENGVEHILAIGCSVADSREQLDLAQRYDFIHAAVGIHPENVDNLPPDWLSRIESMLKEPKAAALGEIGLDYHYEGFDRALQREVFIKQLELAQRLGKPVVVHSRDACGDTMDILKKYKPRGVMHCFSGSAETAREVVGLGMYVGFTGVLTFKDSKKAWAACKAVPADRLLLETDCPYMAPEPFRGKKCNSAMIKYTAEKMAEIKGVSTEEIIEICAANGKRLFGIE